MNWAGVAIGILALLVILAWDLVCYAWVDERVRLLTERVAALEPVDDSPGHEAEMYDLDDVAQEFGVDLDDTDEFPAIPSTEPMPLVVDPTPAVQARRDAAWDEQRPSPVPRGKSAEWVEQEIEAMRARNAERMAKAEEAS